MTIDTEKLKEFTEEADALEQEIREAENRKRQLIQEIDEQVKYLKSKEYRISSKIKKLFPEEFWTCEIDRSYHGPLHYKIKCISYSLGHVYITTQDIRKKKPFDGWKGIDEISLEKFLQVGLYDSYDAALYGYKHRICSRCGGFMNNSQFPWCHKCMDDYKEYLDTSEMNYYDAKQGRIYGVQPNVDPVVYRNFWKGYDGMRFRIRRLDTGEIIETNNLWSRGFGDNDNNYPLIEFLGKDDTVINGPKPTILG